MYGIFSFTIDIKQETLFSSLSFPQDLFSESFAKVHSLNQAAMKDSKC